MSLFFNMLSRLVIAFLLRSKRLLISWLQSQSAKILEPKKIKSLTVSIVSPSICYEVMGPDAMILVFWMLNFKPVFFFFSLYSFSLIKRLFLVALHFLLRWSGILISLRMFQCVLIHTVKGFGIVNKAEVDVFLELFCFFHDPMDVGSLISGSSAFSKSSLNIWMFLSRVLLKPSLENIEHYFASMWHECNCVVVWTFFGIAFLWDWNENWPFPVLGHWWVFQIWWHIECSTLTVSSFRIWKCSSGIPSPLLAVFVVMLPKVHLTLHSKLSGSSWVITPSWLSGSWSFFA